MNSLPNITTVEICKYNQGSKQCRYLSKKDNTLLYYCLKNEPHLKRIIDGEVQASSKEDIPKGDNCDGYKGIIMR